MLELSTTKQHSYAVSDEQVIIVHSDSVAGDDAAQFEIDIEYRIAQELLKTAKNNKIQL